MKKATITPFGKVKVGDQIRIVRVYDLVDPSPAFPKGFDEQARALNGRTGIITSIDDGGNLHGTWGSLSVLPEVDRFEIIQQTDNSQKS